MGAADLQLRLPLSVSRFFILRTQFWFSAQITGAGFLRDESEGSGVISEKWRLLLQVQGRGGETCILHEERPQLSHTESQGGRGGSQAYKLLMRS